MRISRRAGILSALLACGVLSWPVAADEREDLEVLQRTVVNLLQGLVQKGLLSEDEASSMVAAAKQDAQAATNAQPAAPADDPSDVRVTYVPEIVRDEIREQVREELGEQVVADVIAHATDEGWAMSDALPDWVGRTRLTGDFRLRSQGDFFDSGNALNVYRNFQRINQAGGEGLAGIDAFENTSEDRQRLRARLRLNLESQITDALTAGVQITTGNLNNPVSLNQTLGRTSRGYQFFVDQAYLRYQRNSERAGLQLQGGRMPKPWLSTELTWDNDVMFEGVAARGNRALAGGDAFVTLGAFPLQEVELSTRDKWLFGGQLGWQWQSETGRSASLGLAYYDFQNVTGKRNAPQSTLFDFTAPDFLQRGNTLFDIRNDVDPDTNLFALASDFDVAAVYLGLGFRQDQPVSVKLEFEYSRNVGFDQDDILQRTGVSVDEASTGYQIGLQFGHKEIVEARDWRVFTLFRHLERDAIVDAFADSNLHLGGTDSRGYAIGALWGIRRNTWLQTRWLSATEIDGPPLSINMLQLDINSRF